mgnify:FL=1
MYMDYEKIAKFLVELRSEKELTQEALAKVLCVDRGTISKWERAVYLPSIEMLVKISEFYGVTVNELVYGARKNKDNAKDVDNVSIAVMKENVRKVRKLTIFYSTIIFLLVAIMPFIYFFSNYNSIKVYKIGGESEHFNTLNGLMIVTKKNSYIRFGMVNAFNEDDKILEARLYYKNGDEEINLRTRENLEDLIVNKYGYDEYFSYRDVNKFMDNLYLEVKSDKFEETIKLKFRKVESNDDFVYTLNNNVSDDESSNVIDDDIPKYVRDNFKYDSDSKSYVYEHKDGDVSVVEKYFSETQNYVVEENKLTEILKYDFYIDEMNLNFKLIENNNIKLVFDYDIKNSKCLSMSCDNNYLTYFQNNYLKNIAE